MRLFDWFKTVVDDNKIIEEHLTGDVEVGRIEGDKIIDETRFSEPEVGEINRNFFGTPTSVTVEGKELNIEKDFFGNKYLVDEDGNKVSDYNGE